ncbi:MAG: NAD-dependent epimerase/dehydratase family protein [Deltaproteobacteria bacterium]
MKIVVTGGAGFIGSNVCDAFLAKGHEVVALDDLSTGRRANVSKGVRLIEADIRAPGLAELLLAERPQVVCHHAAQIDVRKSVADPAHDAEVNLLGMLRLLEASVAAGVQKFLFASSGGACYGEQERFPADESHPTRPVSPYGVSKAAGELYLGYYRAQHGLPYVALRYANVYGPRQDPHGEAGVVAIFAERLLRGEACTIYGDGGQTRDFVFVGDVARANVLALESSHVGPVNVGTGRETSVAELYRKMAEIGRVATAALHAPAKPGEQRRSVIDPAFAQKAIGWRPEVPLEEGLARTLDFFRSRLAA